MEATYAYGEGRSHGYQRLTGNFNYGQRLLRKCVFQVGVKNACFENALEWIYGILNQKTCCSEGFNSKKALMSLWTLSSCGAENFSIRSLDREGTINMITLEVETLQNKIEELGGTWTKLTLIDEKVILAILPPVESCEEWEALEKGFKKLRWVQQEVIQENGEVLKVFITCENAKELPNNCLKDCPYIIHSNSAGVSFTMLSSRLGYYLGMRMFNVCMYDPRGTWQSEGEASEGGYYNDILSVYSWIEEKKQPRDIWVSGACLGNLSVAYLKRLKPDLKIIIENGFLDLRKDIVEGQGWIVKKFVEINWSGVGENYFVEDERGDSLATNFSVENLWKDSEKGGIIILVNVSNDELVSKEVIEKQFSLAKQVSDTCYQIIFQSQGKKSPHVDRYFNYEEPRNRMIEYLVAHYDDNIAESV